jgi:hypothetical protein
MQKDDAREAALRRERESLMSEVAAVERKTLATENAELQRRLDARRAELLSLETKCVFY